MPPSHFLLMCSWFQATMSTSASAFQQFRGCRAGSWPASVPFLGAEEDAKKFTFKLKVYGCDARFEVVRKAPPISIRTSLAGSGVALLHG